MLIPAQQHPDRCPPHPGEVVEDMLEDVDYSKSAIARMLGISRQQLHAILTARKPVSPEVAARLGKLFGNGPGLWLRLQASYDAWHAERDVDVSAVPSLEEAES
ncbi:HigA family addiction module antitoxin [Halomonas sp. DN3]|uniref:HigA family addiction module antitoxin n=1 Tax=Halomonas TaxID=2745 RepID=UPI00209F2B43|nr:HigA family addiction module antitoxin [Halomonas sp. DN3]USZ49556.1 HigA family addiction module antitoxin [Halomonas sp. DN3]